MNKDEYYDITNYSRTDLQSMSSVDYATRSGEYNNRPHSTECMCDACTDTMRHSIRRVKLADHK